MAEMWFYTRAGKQLGPVPLADLKRLIGEGAVKPGDMVWHEGLPRWVRAGTVPELFTHASTTPEAASALSAVAADSHRVDDAELETSNRPRAAAEDDRLERRRRATTGSSTGIIIFLVLGALVLVGALAGGVFILLAVDRPGIGKSQKGAPINPNNLIKGEVKYELRLLPDTWDKRKFSFRKGIDYELIVKTQPNHQGVDVDLFVFHSSGREEVKDVEDDPNCYRRWTPTEDGEYRVEIQNLNQARQGQPPLNITVTSVVTIREFKPAEKPIEVPVEPPLPDDVREGKNITDVPLTGPGNEQTFRFRVRAGHKASFRVTPLAKADDLDFNLIVVKDGNPETIIAQDVQPAASASVEFTLKTTEIVRVRVVNASKSSAAKAALAFDVSP